MPQANVDNSVQLQDPHDIPFNFVPPPGGFPSSRTNRPHMQTMYKNAYSSTGFDMLGVLMRRHEAEPNHQHWICRSFVRFRRLRRART